MKVFYWPGVVADWQPGFVLAIAPDLERAKLAVLATGDPVEFDGFKIDGVDPVELDLSKPHAFVAWGSA